MFKVVLEHGNRYWDPITKTHLKRTKKERTFTDDFIENYDMTNIEYACSIGTLRKIILDQVEDDTENEEANQAFLNELDEDNNENQEIDENNSNIKGQEENNKEPNMTEENAENEVDEESTEDEELNDNKDDEDDEEIVRCQAVTSSGNQCKNEAIYPENNPKACHIKSHQKQVENL